MKINCVLQMENSMVPKVGARDQLPLKFMRMMHCVRFISIIVSALPYYKKKYLNLLKPM